MSLWKDLNLSSQDRRLLGAFLGSSLLILGVGAAFAVVMVLVRTPALSLLPASAYYEALTGHGTFMFVFWLSFVQTAFLIAAGTVLINSKLWSYKLAWAGLGLMLVAALLALAGVLTGASITYHASVPLAKEYPTSWLIYLSFIVLALGMLVVALDFVLTVLAAVEHKGSISCWAAFFKRIPTSAFAAISGLFIAVPGLVAALKTFVPALLWAWGLGEINPSTYRMSWHVAFHIYHYVPVLTLVGVAYVLVEATAEARSVYASQVAKALFLLYPFFVPPTFLYHLLMDPNIPQNVKFVGTVLSLLVGTPTVLHTFIIVGMLEAKMRRAGYGALGWVKQLPWRNPAFSSMVMGMLTLFVGGLLAYMGLQGQLSPVLHNTFAVPAYIHAIAAGGANITYMGAFFYGLPIVLNRQLWGMKLARVQPYLMGASLLLMCLFGTVAGLAGVPRRYAELGADAPEAWSTWMNLSLGVGGVLALVAIVLFLVVMGMTAMRGKKVDSPKQAIHGLEALTLPQKVTYNRTPVALVPPIVFIVGIVVLTLLAFDFLRSIPNYGL